MYCEWYKGICPQKGCDGNGSVYCKMRKKEIFCDRRTGQYRNTIIKKRTVDKVVCLSFLEKTLSESSLSL